MRVVALISGGKDSCYNMMQCVAEGHQIIALANLKPKDKDELDSYMYQTVGHHAIDLYAEAMGLPLYRRTIQGGSVSQGKQYAVTQGDEVEDLYELLKQVKDELQVEAVSVGAILSDYQRVRVENVCQRLGLISLAYLWRRDQDELLREMAACGVDARIIKVAALGLDPKKHLGKSLVEIYPHMVAMREKFGLNECGEGGEYETFTLDCPLFNYRLVLEEAETVIHSADAFAPVAYLNLVKLSTEKKQNLPESLLERLSGLPMKRGRDLYTDLFGAERPEEEPTQTPQDDQPDRVARTLQEDTMLIHRGAEFVCITGICGYKEDGKSTEELTKIAMDKFTAVLEKAGTRTQDLVAVHLYVSDMAHFARINSVYIQYFGSDPPMRALVQTCLPDNILLQLDCVAVAMTTTPPPQVSTMHVQGLSHWAPASIGPYSQAKQVSGLVFVAGQIGMCPADLSVLAGFDAEARLSLRHVARVLAAVVTGAGVADVTSGVCYVTRRADIEGARREYTRAAGGQLPAGCRGDVIEYVVVETLPKNALIEWQVVAQRRAEEGDDDVQELKTTRSSHTHQADISAFRSQGQVNFIVHIAAKSDASSPRDLEHAVLDLERAVLDLALTSVSAVLSALTAPPGGLRVLRVFYRPDVLDINLLNQAYQSLGPVLSADGEVPAVAFVPVVGLEDENTVLSVCH